jgi:pimeloyl-ACP methyl ester carboxylesterase
MSEVIHRGPSWKGARASGGRVHFMPGHDGLASVLLVHGAASGPWVFDRWLDRLTGARTEAVDLQEGLDVAHASMRDYADRLAWAAEALPRPLAICAWSMGGLVAMMAAARVEPACLVLLEASPSAEIRGTDPEVELAHGTFDGEATYGAFPVGVRSRPESALARAERKRGISVPRLPGPTLVVSGREFPRERGRVLAEAYECDELAFPELDHWGLVLDGRVSDAIGRHLAL